MTAREDVPNRVEIMGDFSAQEAIVLQSLAMIGIAVMTGDSTMAAEFMHFLSSRKDETEEIAAAVIKKLDAMAKTMEREIVRLEGET